MQIFFFVSMFVNWVQQALSNFLFVFRFFSQVLVVTNEPPLVLQSCFCMKTSIISKCNNKTGQDLTDNNNVPLYHSTKNSGEERGWYNSDEWDQLFERRQARHGPDSHQSIFAGLTEESYHGASTSTCPDQDCSTWHSTVTTILKFFCSARSDPVPSFFLF